MKGISLASFENRKKTNKEEKERIARKVLEFIHKGNTLFLGAGSTVTYVAEALANSRKHFMLKVWTNNLAVINLWLQKYEKMFIENFIGVVGGEVMGKNLSVVNILLPFHNLPIAIIGTPGISTHGLTADDVYTVQQVESLIKKVEEVVICADSSKIGKECTYTARSIRMIKRDLKMGKKYRLVTVESEKNKEELERLSQIGFEIIRV